MGIDTNTSEQSPVMFEFTGALAVRRKQHSNIEKCLFPLLVAAEQGIDTITNWYYSEAEELASSTERIVADHLGFVPVERSVRSLAKVVLHKKQKYPERPLVLAGHSIGGLFAERLALQHPELNVSAVIVIASPHTTINRLASILLGGLDKKQFGPNTEKIQELREDLGKDAPRVHYVGARRDWVVPVDSSIPEIDDTEKTLLQTGHLGVMHHPTTLGIIQEALETAA